LILKRLKITFIKEVMMLLLTEFGAVCGV